MDSGVKFSPLIKVVTIHLVLSTIVAHSWLIKQLDVSVPFYKETLKTKLYIKQPIRFTDWHFPQQESLYGLQ